MILRIFSIKASREITSSVLNGANNRGESQHTSHAWTAIAKVGSQFSRPAPSVSPSSFLHISHPRPDLSLQCPHPTCIALLHIIPDYECCPSKSPLRAHLLHPEDCLTGPSTTTALDLTRIARMASRCSEYVADLLHADIRGEGWEI